MTKTTKESVLSYAIPALCCGVLAFLDQLCQQPIEKLSIGGWAGVFLRASGYGFLLASGMLLLGRFAKWIVVPTVPVLLLIICTEFFVRRNFEWNFHGDWILLMQATSPGELNVFFGEYGVSICVSILVFIGLSMLYVWVVTRWHPPRFGFARIVVALVFLVPFYFFDFRTSNPLKSFNNMICCRVIPDTLRFSAIYSEMGSVVASPELPDALSTVVATSELPTCVFVIGESMTRNNMHVYGYARDTTPFLDSIRSELCIFSDVVGVWNQTPMAIYYLYTAATYERQSSPRYTLSQVAKRAGYLTSFFSCQGRMGAMANMVTYTFNDCQNKVHLCEEVEKAGKGGRSIHDMELVPYFRRQLECAKDRPQVIFLHLGGCHYPCYYLTDDSEKVFSGNKKSLDDYDACVRHDDRLFGEVIVSLSKLKRPAVMFYVSDHGETPRSKTWRDMSSPDMWEMPVIIWFSPEYRQKFPETVERLQKVKDLPLQTDLLLPAMIDCLQVADKSVDMIVKPRLRRLTHMWQQEYRKTVTAKE